MAFAWNFRHSLLFFSALARRCEGWHSLVARLLTLRRVSPFLRYRWDQVPFLTQPRTTPSTPAWTVPGGNPSQHLGKTEGEDFRASWEWKGREISWGVKCSVPVLTQQARGYSLCSRAGHSRCPQSLGCWWCGCPSPQQVDRSISCSPSFLSPPEPRWALLAENPPHETRCLRLRRKGTILSRHFNPNTCSSQSHPKAETYPVPAFSCQWALGQSSHPFSLPPFSAFLSPLQPYLGLLLLQRKSAQLTFILHCCLRMFSLCGLREWLYFLAREGKKGRERVKLLVRIRCHGSSPFAGDLFSFNLFMLKN